MRSILAASLALSLSAASAFAAPNVTTFHRHTSSTSALAKPQMVRVVFRNTHVVDCVLVVGEQRYALPHFASLPLFVATGSSVQVYSSQNSHLHGQTLLNVTSADDNRTVTVQ